MKLLIDGQAYELDPDELGNDDAILIEDELGLTALELIQGVRRLSMRAMTAVVWVARRRDEPDLEFDAVKFKLGQIEIEDDEADEAPKDESPENPPEPSGAAGTRRRSRTSSASAPGSSAA